jgi:long-subunit acyl-CoA synthetase (AMP-forming)
LLRVRRVSLKVAWQPSGHPGLSFGDVGEIVCQSPLATHGYYKIPEATTVSFRDGGFYTGDLGYFDEECNLFVLGAQERYG